MSRSQFVDYFLAISSMHLRLKELSSEQTSQNELEALLEAIITQSELEELVEVLNDCHRPALGPDQQLT